MKKLLSIGIVGNIPKPYGGVATVCFHLSEQLTKLGHQVFFYDRDANPNKTPPAGLNQFKVTGWRYFFPMLRVWLAALGSFLTETRFRKFVIASLCQQRTLGISPFSKTALLVTFQSIEIAQYFRDSNLSILHGNHAGFSSLAALFAAKYYLKVPIVVTIYASEFTIPELRPWVGVAKYICDQADSLISISHYTQEQAVQCGVSKQAIKVIHLGVDPVHFCSPAPEHQNKVAQTFHISDSKPLILYTGWLIQRKGPHILVEALNKIRGLDWRAVLVGPDHGFKDNLEALVDEYGLHERIEISEAIDFSSLLALYSLANIFVFPTLSNDEGFGLVALEAMAHGLPVIASRTGAIPEVVRDQETGFFFAPGSSSNLAQHLETLITNPGLGGMMGEKARDWAKTFQWEKTASRTVETYLQAIHHYAELAV